MTTRLIALAVCGLALAAPADPNVKELDAKDLRILKEPGDVAKPAVMASADDLAKAYPAAADRLAKDVDFSAQQVLVFGWSGSGGDKLTYGVEKGPKGPAVVFQYRGGETDDLRRHVRVFAIPKEATWTVQQGK